MHKEKTYTAASSANSNRYWSTNCETAICQEMCSGTRIALFRKMLVAAYYMLKRGTTFLWVNHDLYERKKSRVYREAKRINERSFDHMAAIAEEVVEKGA